MAAPIPPKDQPVKHCRTKRYEKRDYDGSEQDENESRT